MRRTLCISVLICGLANQSFVAPALGDLVKLKDGTVLDGNILVEDDKQIIIDAELASGTITKRETVRKSDVAEVVRSTEAQKLERQMLRDYESLLKYQLDPANSLSSAQYDQVINTVFRRFLTQYTNSPYQQEITGKITQWQAERDRVAGGETKYRGRWMSTTEAGTLAEQERGQRLLDQGRALIAKGRFDEAMKSFHGISLMSKDAALAAEARRLEADAHRQWVSALERQRADLDAEIKSCDQRRAMAQEARDRAVKNLDSYKSHSNAGQLGERAFDSQYRHAVETAQSELMRYEVRLVQLREQIPVLDQQISDVKTRAPAGAGPAPAQATDKQEAPPPPPPPPPPGPLDQVVEWFRKYWIFAAAGLLIGLWAISRFFTRQ